MAGHPQLRAPHVNQRLPGMLAAGLVDFHVITRHPKLHELLVYAHELQMDDISADGFTDQVGPGIPDRRQLFVEPSFHRTARDLPNRPAGLATEQQLQHYIIVLGHGFFYCYPLRFRPGATQRKEQGGWRPSIETASTLPGARPIAVAGGDVECTAPDDRAGAVEGAAARGYLVHGFELAHPQTPRPSRKARNRPSTAPEKITPPPTAPGCTSGIVR